MSPSPPGALPPAARHLSIAASVLFVIGLALAVVRPGDLGDSALDSSATPATTTTVVEGDATSADPSPTTTTGDPALGEAAVGAVTAPTTGDPGSGDLARGDGSGLGAAGAPPTSPDATAATGHDELVVPALVLVALGWLGRPRRALDRQRS